MNQCGQTLYSAAQNAVQTSTAMKRPRAESASAFAQIAGRLLRRRERIKNTARKFAGIARISPTERRNAPGKPNKSYRRGRVICLAFTFISKSKGQKGTIMNYTNNPIIIGIDHGYGNIKTVFQNSFTFSYGFDIIVSMINRYLYG